MLLNSQFRKLWVLFHLTILIIISIFQMLEFYWSFLAEISNTHSLPLQILISLTEVWFIQWQSFSLCFDKSINMSPLSITLGHVFKGQEKYLEVLRIRGSLPILQAVIYTRVKVWHVSSIGWLTELFSIVLLPHSINSNDRETCTGSQKVCWVEDVCQENSMLNHGNMWRGDMGQKYFSVNSTLLCAKGKASSLSLFLSYQCDTEGIIYIQRDKAAETILRLVFSYFCTSVVSFAFF